MKWSQLKKRIQGKLADSFRNRIDFGITRYANSYTMSRGWISIDKQEILNMSTVDHEYKCHYRCQPGRTYREIGKELNEVNIFPHMTSPVHCLTRKTILCFRMFSTYRPGRGVWLASKRWASSWTIT